jgi:hypothetical protein
VGFTRHIRPNAAPATPRAPYIHASHHRREEQVEPRLDLTEAVGLDERIKGERGQHDQQVNGTSAARRPDIVTPGGRHSTTQNRRRESRREERRDPGDQIEGGAFERAKQQQRRWRILELDRIDEEHLLIETSRV